MTTQPGFPSVVIDPPLGYNLYLRVNRGFLDLNTGAVHSAEAPPVVERPDGFVLGVTEPTAANTGPSRPELLIRQDGSITTSFNGQVIENLDLYGEVIVRHEDVVVRNSIVRGPATPSANGGCINATAAAVKRLLVDRVLIAPQTPSYFLNGIQGHDFTARRVHIRDVVDYFGLFNTHATRVNNTYPLNVRVEGVYGERMAYFSPDPNQPGDNQTHNDGLQIQGGQGVVLVGSRIVARYGPAGTAQPPVTGPTPSANNPSLACVLLNNNVGTTGLHQITDNWFEGAFRPFNLGGAAGVNVGTVHRNRFDGLSGERVSPPSTITRRSDQTLDAGVGTPNQNVFFDGTPITVRIG